jgi:ATP-binding cassette subfamily B protein
MTEAVGTNGPDSAAGENYGRTLRTLAVHLWPQGRWDLKSRVLLALASLVAAKLVNVGVPLLYRDAVDALTPGQAIIAAPLGLIFAYGAARVLVQVFGEFRDFVFAKVGYHAQRTLALSTFRHLHALALRFHLERRTGGLSRVIERGTNGIDFLLNFMTFNILPTLVEIALVAGVLFYTLSAAYALAALLTIGLYVVFTLKVTDWRVKYRRRMNESDEEANTKAIDSLLNYETVKYFGNEEHEHARFDRALARYESAAVKSQTSLSALNVGQGAIIGVGLALSFVVNVEEGVEYNPVEGDSLSESVDETGARRLTDHPLLVRMDAAHDGEETHAACLDEEVDFIGRWNPR